MVKENSRADAKDSRTGSEGCKLKEAVEGKREKKQRVPMDRCKKIQCWVVLKRLMIDPDGMAFKQPVDPKASGVADNFKVVSKPMGLQAIESKLCKGLYSRPDEFAADIRLVFSNALLYPSKNELCRMARRLGENFELRWKSLEERWAGRDGKEKKDCEREVCSKVHNPTREFHEKKTQKGNKGHRESRKDSLCCDANKSLSRLQRIRPNTYSSDRGVIGLNYEDSCSKVPNFKGQIRSKDSSSQKELNISVCVSQLSPQRGSYIVRPKLDSLLTVQESMHDLYKADSERKQKEKEGYNRVARLEKEREAARVALQQMKGTADIEDNLKIYEELELLCGQPLSNSALRSLGLFLKD